MFSISFSDNPVAAATSFIESPTARRLVAKSKNLFLSDNDLKVTKKYLTQCGKHIEEVYVKAQNAQKLL